MARPRLVSDKVILAAAYDILMEYGLRGLTFEKLAASVGLVPAALVRRFKNKRGLLLQVDRYALEHTTDKLEEAMRGTTSAVNAIIVLLATELAFASTLEHFINGQEFLLAVLRDRDLYANYERSFVQRHRQVMELLQRAQQDGELEEIADVSGLARHLETIQHGAGHVWAMTQDAPIEEYIRHHIEYALIPYRKRREVTM